MFIFLHFTYIGVHSAVLSTEGAVEHIHWPRNNTAADTKYDDNDDEDGHNSDHPIHDPATAEIIKNNPDLYYTGTRPKDSDAYIYDKVPAWADIVTSLDPDRDVLLFPCDSAVDAKTFDWNYSQPQPASSFASSSTATNNNTCSSTSCSSVASNNSNVSKVRKRRLVVVEATWQHGKVVANRINKYRKAHSLPPIPCVKLSNITGSYWRFQDQGHSAVSSIEAIAHTAVEAGSNVDTYNTLLMLFRLQKYRVLSSIQNGGKVPKVRYPPIIHPSPPHTSCTSSYQYYTPYYNILHSQAILVAGTGIGSWKEVIDTQLLSLPLSSQGQG